MALFDGDSLLGNQRFKDLKCEIQVTSLIAHTWSEITHEKGFLKYEINSTTLERFMEWKFPYILPQVFRDMDLILKELKLFGLGSIKELNELVSDDFVNAVRKMGWRSLDGIIRNILIISDSDKYFEKVWNSAMNTMNEKNYELYKAFNLDIDRICSKYDIRRL